MAKSGILLLFILLCFTPVRMKLIIEGCLGAVIGTLGGAALLGYVARCSFTECCKGRWIAVNITGLQPALRRRVFGQHLVTETVLKAIVGHLNNKSPRKALGPVQTPNFS